MARWIQKYDAESDTYELVPADESAFTRDADAGILVRGKFDAFRSPIDGSVISTHREYSEHCRRHNVVPAQEFSPEFFERKAREREKLYRREFSPGEKYRRKQEIHELINHLERQND